MTIRPLLVALVLRPLVRERSRTLLTISGIAVGVAVLVAIQLANESALRSFRESVDAVAGRANVQIVSETVPFDETILLALQPLWNLGGRFAPVIDLEGTAAPDGVPIRILGVDLLSDLHFRDYRYAKIETIPSSEVTVPGFGQLGTSASEGSMLALFRDDAIIVPETFARERGLALGSPFALTVNGERVELVVRGLLRAEGPATAFHGSLAIVDLATAQRRFGMRGKLTRVDLLLPEEQMARALAVARAATPAHARLEPPSRRNERVGKMLQAFRINLFALSAVALLVGIFLVYNTVLISVLRRRRDVGIIKTLGATRAEVVAAFLAEGFVFGVAGSALGVALGYGLARAILGLVGKTIELLYVAAAPESIVLSPSLAAVTIAAGTAVALLASIQPALEAGATPPNALIRPGIDARADAARVHGLAAGALTAFAAAALLSRIPAVGSISAGGYAAVLAIVIGVSLLAPIALASGSRALRGPLAALARVPGTLAAKSLPASLRRASIATAALSIAIGMMVAVAVMIGSFRETVEAWVAQTVRSDLWLRPARSLGDSVSVFPEAITDELRTIPFIAAFDRFRGRELVYGDSIVTVGSGDFDVSIREGDLPMVAPRSAARALGDAIARDGVLVSESFAIKFGKRVGDALNLPAPSGARSLPITGIYRDYSNDRGVIVMDRRLFIEIYGDATINTIAVFLEKGVDAARARAALEARLGPRWGAFATLNATIRKEVMRIFDQTFLITYALLLVAIVVAVLGIVNTLSALLLERESEIALLRILGMSEGEVRVMLLLESLIVAIVSTLLGIATGYALSYILIFVINKQSFGWTIQFDPPLAWIAASLAATFFATMLAGLIPAARRAAR